MKQDEVSEILLIDKPAGITSHDVVNVIRRQTGVKRVGHAGTLDPLATGLLIILVGRNATRRQPEFLKQDKEYLCTAQLGISTDTYDRDGQIMQQVPWEKVKKVTTAKIQTALNSFVGESSQQVPAFSAIKQHGQKLYELARKGQINVSSLPIRSVTVHHVEILKADKDEPKKTFTVTFQVACSSGTYIRSLVHDFGQKIGTGAIVTQLRRTKIGMLKIEDAKEL